VLYFFVIFFNSFSAVTRSKEGTTTNTEHEVPGELKNRSLSFYSLRDLLDAYKHNY